MRNQHGGSLILTITLIAAAGLAILGFGLKYASELGSYQEQCTAIDAAALAAAKDLSRIVVLDPNFGYIALSDYAPTGSAVTASDGYSMPVLGINTILATARLDMIIADYMQDPVMKLLAQKDYQNAIAAETALIAKLQSVINTGGSGNDVDGNVIYPLQDATAEYKKNAIRMGGKASLVPGSLQLKLGYVQNSQTSRALLPSPAAAAQIPTSQQISGYYQPDVEILYKGGSPVVFAALGADVLLVNQKKFVTTVGVQNSIPTVVYAQAQEAYQDRDTYGSIDHTISVASAAEANAIIDQRPNPGALSLSFPNGPPTGITQLSDLFKQQQLATDPTDLLQTALNGDYPLSPVSNYAMQNINASDPYHPPFTSLVSVGFYDWLRRAGPYVNVSSLLTTLSNSLNTATPGPQVHLFQCRPDGTINYKTQAMGQTNYCVSQDQFRAVSGLGFDSVSASGTTTNCYDVQLTDYVHVPGTVNGGKHGGEPLPLPGQTVANPNQVAPGTVQFTENTSWPYQSYTVGSASSTVRPTYNQEGIAVDFTFRLQ